MGVVAPHAALFNLPETVIERFRKEMALIDLQFESNQDVIRQAVWAVTAVNTSLGTAPETVRKDPYGTGWMVKFTLANAAELNELMGVRL